VYPPTLKSSTIPQPEAVKEYLMGLINADEYNKFCVDCLHTASTHANINFGTFICENCAHTHRQTFGMSKSYVKTLFTEQWDDYQLSSMSIEIGGNKAFFEILKEFNINTLPIDEKYVHPVAKFYSRKHLAYLDGKQFNELPPPKDWNERLARMSSTVVLAANKFE